MKKIVRMLLSLHDRIFAVLSAAAEGWFMGLAARLAFGSVLLVFFLNSAGTKVGSGFPGFLIPGAGAYVQIIPPVAEAAGYDPGSISFIPWGLIAYLGTYAEFLIPLLVFVGLFTRLTSLAMIGFIAVMTFVDIQFHHVDSETIGAFFDRVSDSAISDQRLLWILPLVYLVLHGAGAVSVDGLLSRLKVGSRLR